MYVHNWHLFLSVCCCSTCDWRMAYIGQIKPNCVRCVPAIPPADPKARLSGLRLNVELYKVTLLSRQVTLLGALAPVYFLL